MEIRTLTSADAKSFWLFRLEALETEPVAFTESALEHRDKSLESIAARLGSGENEDFVMGAFVDEQLVGMSGFFRRTEAKARHRGVIWGVYIEADFRRRGFGQLLMSEVIRRACVQAGLEQIELAVACDRPAAKSLYLSLGFASCRIMPRALKVNGAYVDEEWMILKV